MPSAGRWTTVVPTVRINTPTFERFIATANRALGLNSRDFRKSANAIPVCTSDTGYAPHGRNSSPQVLNKRLELLQYDIPQHLDSPGILASAFIPSLWPLLTVARGEQADEPTNSSTANNTPDRSGDRRLSARIEARRNSQRLWPVRQFLT